MATNKQKEKPLTAQEKIEELRIVRERAFMRWYAVRDPEDVRLAWAQVLDLDAQYHEAIREARNADT
jgi:hypothetical protein